MIELTWQHITSRCYEDPILSGPTPGIPSQQKVPQGKFNKAGGQNSFAWR